ncbi:MAG TPA: Gfo/Idh/MocA family oxidoreductase [Candidatus Atribacteria bacterium]|nr:Gfo/Idh/MocA family oxidoreductase [Candidatus Atribacteria bacterium]
MVGIGVIGTGYWGKNHVRNWKELLSEGVIDELVLCDMDKNRVKELADENISYTTNYKDLLDNNSIDAIDIVTPSKTHFLLGKEALIAGKDVFIEKPMTIGMKKSEKLIDLTEKNDSILMVGHIFRYHSGIEEVKKRIDRGEFGKIYYMATNRMAFSSPRRDMGVMYALGIHEIDLYCYLMDVKYPKKITVSFSSFLQPDVEEIASICMKFDNNVSGYAFESWISPFHTKIRDFILVGSKRSIKIDYLKPQELLLFDGTITSYQYKDRISFDITDEGITKISIPYKEPLNEELKHFISCIKSRKQPLTDMYAGKRAVEMIEKCLNQGHFP